MTTQHKAVQRVDELQAWALNAAVDLRRLREEAEINGTIIQYHEASIARLTAQRDALLEACIAVDVWLSSGCGTGFGAKVRAAIKTVEEGK